MRGAPSIQMLFVLLIVNLSVSGATSNAQVIEILRPRPVQEVLQNFEQTHRTGPSRTPHEFRHPEKYTPARVDSLLDGFERIALTAENKVAAEAAYALGDAAAAWHAPLGTFDRVLRVYERNSREVRWMIVGSAAGSREHERALRFVASIAIQDHSNEDFDGSAFLAAQELTLMGKDGLATLANLYNTKRMRDAKALGFTRWYLESRAPTQHRKKCRTDWLVLTFMVELERLQKSTDPETVARLPVLRPNTIHEVEDETVCTKLAAAIGNYSNKAPPAEVYVVSLGSKGYAAWDPTDPRGDYRTVHVFDNRYARVGGWTER